MIHPMEEANPYAPPVVVDTLTAQPGEYRVEGRYLWVTDGVVLPRRCIRTNQPIGPEDFELTITLRIRPRLRLRSVRVTYYLLESEFRSVRRRRWFAFPLIIGGLTSYLADGSWPDFAAPALIVAGIVISESAKTLTCARCQGPWFQIRGPSRKFVRSLDSTP
jgi:hypothetical protein